MKPENMPTALIGDRQLKIFAVMFQASGLCASRGEFMRHLKAGAIRISVGDKKQAVVNHPVHCDDL